MHHIVKMIRKARADLARGIQELVDDPDYPVTPETTVEELLVFLRDPQGRI